MMVENNHSSDSKMTKKRFGWLQVIGLLVIAVIVAVGITVLIFKIYFFPSAFKPVTLNAQEEQALAVKLKNLDSIGSGVTPRRDAEPKVSSKADGLDPKAALEPEAYDEEGMKREIAFTEREINALLAKNTNLARKLAIDLTEDLVSANLLLPVDEDFPVLGGKTLRVKTGLVLRYDKGKPVVILKGVTLMGVPIPNAWLGGKKHMDLVKEFGHERGFWKTFSDGVESIKVEEGILRINLKE